MQAGAIRPPPRPRNANTDESAECHLRQSHINLESVLIFFRRFGRIAFEWYEEEVRVAG